MSAADLSVLQRPHDRLRRRRVVNRGMELLAWLAAALAVPILGIVIFSVARRGASALNFDFLTKSQLQFAPPNVKQGLANAFVGTLVIVGLATLMALPVRDSDRDLRERVRLEEHPERGDPHARRPRRRPGDRDRVLRLRTDRGRHGQSGYAGAFALAVLMLPLVARSTIEVLVLVPNSLREAALGVGAPRWRTTLGVVLPQTIGGVLTGATLAVARVAGETAPLLLVSSLGGERDPLEPVPAARDRSPRDLRARRLARSGRPCARLGGCARADAVHPRREPHSAMARHS